MRDSESHLQNTELYNAVNESAKQNGLTLTHFATSFSNHAGRHSYVLSAGPTHSIRGKTVVTYESCPYSRNWLPSIKRERNCLLTLQDWLKPESFARRANELKQQKQRDVVLNIARKQPIMVEFSDSIRAGNCPRGTAEFARDIGFPSDLVECAAAPTNWLLQLRDDEYTRRACYLAAIRQGVA